jgi:RNA polymerase-binding transcription factor
MLTTPAIRPGGESRPLEVVLPQQASPGRMTAADLQRWRARLEIMWRRTVDEIVADSLALYEAAPPAEFVPEWQDEIARGDGQVARLRDTVLRLHETRAEIEAAIGRIRSGRFGQCELCGRPIAAEVLAATPQASACQECAVR